MKKIIAVMITAIMVCSLAACGSSSGGSADAAQTTEAAANAAGSEKIDSTEGPQLAAEEQDVDCFACVLMDNASVFWIKGVNLPSVITQVNNLREAPMVSIQEIDGVMYMIADEIPDWYLEEQDRFDEALAQAKVEWEAAPMADLDNLQADVDMNGPEVIDEESTEGGRMFAGVLLDNGHVEWELGVTQPSQLIEDPAELEEGNKALFQVQHLPNGSWELCFIKEVPGWFNDELMQNIKNAFAEWEAADMGGGPGPQGGKDVDYDKAINDLNKEGPVSVTEEVEKGRTFGCLVMDNGHVEWDNSTSRPSELLTLKGKNADEVAQVQIVHGDGNVWTMQVLGDIPGWFDESVQRSVWEAFVDWDSAPDEGGGPDMNDPKNQG